MINDVSIGAGEWREGCRYRLGDLVVSDQAMAL